MNTPDEKPLDGKTALVTGGSRGIGRAIAVELARMGAFVGINYVRNEKEARTTLERVRTQGGAGDVLQFDVADLNAVTAAVQGMMEHRGRIDILVNNAGMTQNGLFVRTKPETWDSVMGVNLTGAFNCCQAVIRYMIKQRWGRIINMTSVVALSGNAGQAAYSASKAGIVGLTRSLARELSSRNICVNAVAPGLIATDMTGTMEQQRKGAVMDQVPLGRAGTPDDVAGVVGFLASAKADYITGQVIQVNGGLYM
jgi:3-oxoacyl-[acyl-carrier protein] reductase